ncbi:dynein assembly factor 3, axonemal-like protein [Anopheles sinensis]|uniref:Dynein assembly factor 3, axonemal-like protein n=1 Tax=Anopheles sinensis TaxID=74873 RepID=A0A084W5S7_ANOSI|nr:dynein assembly factor 3, axonemal-like protein [Anopheles sinensis]
MVDQSNRFDDNVANSTESTPRHQIGAPGAGSSFRGFGVAFWWIAVKVCRIVFAGDVHAGVRLERHAMLPGGVGSPSELLTAEPTPQPGLSHRRNRGCSGAVPSECK